MSLISSTIEELEQHFEQAHLAYLQVTDQRTQDFKYLTAKDQELSRDIELKIRKIERLQSSIAHWRTKIAQNVKECTERNRALEEEKNAISGHYQKLKARMNRMRDDHKRRLADLSNNARNAKKSLDDQLGLAERIISLGELVRKLETERERVLPFYHSTLADEKEANEVTENVRLAVRPGIGWKHVWSTARQRDLMMLCCIHYIEQVQDEESEDLIEFQPHGVVNGVTVSEWEYLDLFWKRYNKVLLDDLAIQREKQRYENENRELQAILKQYLDGISVNDTVLNTANPLLVVNGRLKLHQPDGAAHKPKPVIDANHMVTTNRVSK
jgi:dynein regulatory complex subunit 2